MPAIPFSTSTVWPPHALSLPKVRLRFKVCELCSPLSVVIYLFCSSSIGSKFQTKSWSALFSSSSIGSHRCSFDPLMVCEWPASLLPVLAIGTLSIGIFAFSVLASFGAFLFYLIIFTIALDRFSNPAGPFGSSNFNLPPLIRSWTSRLNALQSSTEWPGTLEW